MVESIFEHRTVGCNGGPTEADEHDILWHNVLSVSLSLCLSSPLTAGSENKPLICVECGQVFKLKKLDILAEEEAPHH